MNSRTREAPNKRGAAVGIAAISENNQQTKHSGNESSAQCARLLAGLRIGPITTLESRRALDILHPAARVQELREQGHNIVTVWTHGLTSEGNTHRVAKYVLMMPRNSMLSTPESDIAGESKESTPLLGRAGNNDQQGSLDLGAL
jgi:hypothetical protein